ncbi:hypothetical protein [Streptomyces sp. NPDC088261]|uniref:hypothetical protein n=1 Tax=Streptomyces sp. NPDC088261 TaxID=3365851 RepID=UPI0037F94DA4
MGSWIIAVAIGAIGALCLSFRTGARLRGALKAGLVIAVLCGLMGAGQVFFADPARMCDPLEPIPDWNRYEERLFPPRAACHWADGRTYELVSVWVNPMLFTALGVAVVCLLALAVSRYRKGPLH